jgi:hypothetical protein
MNPGALAIVERRTVRIPLIVITESGDCDHGFR